MVTKRCIWNLYNDYKKIARAFEKNNNIEATLATYRNAAAVMYTYQLILSDPEIDMELKRIGERFTIGETDEKKAVSIIFYDSCCDDQLVLGRQYCKALLNLNISFVYIGMGNPERIPHTYKEMLASERAYMHFIPREATYTYKIQQIQKYLGMYKATTALLQMDNCDVSGVAVWSNINIINRYYINHGDEQFWLGANVVDRLINFRNMGVNTAIKFRGIDKKKNCIIPYYPIIRTEQFEGLREVNDKEYKIIYSGGRFEKIYSEDFRFFRMVVDILNENPNAVFLFSGSGDPLPLKELIEKSKVQDRFFVISYRKDLTELLKHVNVFLATYPVSGGLMVQYAANACVPVVELAGNAGSRARDFLPKLNKNIELTFDTEQEVLTTIKQYLNDDELSKSVGGKISLGLITEEEFTRLLYDVVFNNQDGFVQETERDEISNIELRAKRILETENQALHRFCRLSLTSTMLKKRPIKFLVNTAVYIYYFGFSSYIGKIRKHV